MEEKLINAMRNHPYLYDKADGRYKNRIYKEKKWIEVSKEINQPVAKIKARWRSLRDRFHREFKKTKLPSGSKACDQVYWQYFEGLKFLKDFSYQRETDTNCPDEEEQDADDETNDANWKNFIIDESTDFLQQISTPRKCRDVTPEAGNSEAMNSSSSASLRGSNSNLPLSFGQKPKTGNQRDVILKEMTSKFNNFLDNATSFVGSKDSATPVELFFKSIAKQVDNANVDFSTWCEIQSDIIEIIGNKLNKTC